MEFVELQLLTARHPSVEPTKPGVFRYVCPCVCPRVRVDAAPVQLSARLCELLFAMMSVEASARCEPSYAFLTVCGRAGSFSFPNACVCV